MPELPEVEVTRRSFADRIASAKILALHMGKPLRWPLGLSPQGLVGQQVLGVRRRGKYLLLDLDQGLLLVHLGMSGSLNFAPTQPEAGPHDHMDLVTDRGCCACMTRAVLVRWSGLPQRRPRSAEVAGAAGGGAVEWPV